jgi:hypothetical protein
MIVCGFFQPLGSMPKPIFRYPLSYISFHTYAFNGMMKNEFPADSVVECPCSAMPAPWTCTDCIFTGNDVLAYYQMDLLNLSKASCSSCMLPYRYSCRIFGPGWQGVLRTRSWLQQGGLAAATQAPIKRA